MKYYLVVAEGAIFPSAVFVNLNEAYSFIRKNKITCILLAYMKDKYYEEKQNLTVASAEEIMKEKLTENQISRISILLDESVIFFRDGLELGDGSY